MKNLFTISIIATTVLLAASCKKNEECNCEPNNSTSNNNLTQKEETLTAKTWKMTGLIAGNVDAFDTQYKDCEKDNIHWFKANYEYVLDEGATKCYPQAPQSQSNNWKFLENETKLQFNGYTHTINELTESIMVLEIKNGGLLWVFTYTAQ